MLNFSSVRTLGRFHTEITVLTEFTRIKPFRVPTRNITYLFFGPHFLYVNINIQRPPLVILTKKIRYWKSVPGFHFLSYRIMPKKSKSKVDKCPSVVEVKSIPLKMPVKTDSEDNVLIEVYAKPGAKQNAVVDISDEGINIQINAPPVEGSANTELVKYVAAFLGLKSSCVSLERGHKSRNKVVKISGGVSKLDVIRKINAELPVPSKLLAEC